MFRTFAHYWNRNRRRDGDRTARAVDHAVGTRQPSRGRHGAQGLLPHFQTSDRCFPCHNGVTSSKGEDLSIGIAWRTSMMGIPAAILTGWLACAMKPSTIRRPRRPLG